MRRRCVWPTSLSLCGVLLLGLFLLPSLAWGSLRVGNAEIQVFYAQNHQFLYDDNTYGIQWAQFRNELSFKFTYEKLISEGLLFDQIKVPYVDRAHFFAYYRGRYDPVYLIRKSYRGMLDKDTREKFVFPENEFREFFLDVDYGRVGPGELGMRLGRQQIVWGESDLFRSLDIINPLRVDQSSLVGEKFDEYRTPLWFIKFLYNIGNVGPFSEVGIEPFYGANWMALTSDVLISGLFRLYDNDRPRYWGVSPTAGGLTFRRKGVKAWKNFVRSSPPWDVTRQASNMKRDAPAYICLETYNCIGSQRGERLGVYIAGAEHDKGDLRWKGPHGWSTDQSIAGVRVLGKTGFGVDFSLNYMFKHAELSGSFDIEELLNRDASLATIGALGPGRGIMVPRLDRIYGVGIPGQDLATGIARCVGSEKSIKGIPGAPAGVLQSAYPGSTTKAGGQRIGDKGKSEAAILVGADLHGYNSNANPDDDIGIGAGGLTTLLGLQGPLAGAGIDLSQLGPMIPVTACARGLGNFPWTHIAAFTATYNDYDYTGAIFRLEQQLSTKEARMKAPVIIRRALNIASVPEKQLRLAFTDNFKAYTPVWKSMVGFDLIRSPASFPGLHWLKYAPGDMGNQVAFFTFQYLSEYQFENFSNNFPASTGPICASFAPADRCSRFNHAFTLAYAQLGLFRGAFDPLAAIGWDLNVDAPLAVYRMTLHGLFGYKPLDFYGGTAVYMSSINKGSWLLQGRFADKDVLWLRLIYYLL